MEISASIHFYIKITKFDSNLGNANIVEYLLSVPDLVMIKDKIAALELLGATFVDNKKDMTGALGFWRRAMELR